MPELDITDEQAAFLDALRDAIEDQLVGPYGTVRRQDALQYLIDNFGEPAEIVGEGVDARETDAVDSEEEAVEDDSEDTSDGAASEDEEEATDDEGAEEQEADSEGDEEDTTDSSGDAPTPTPGGGGSKLDEMMALLDDNDDKWREADTEETKYEVDLPDGSTETVQTKDDVRALLFKNYR